MGNISQEERNQYKSDELHSIFNTRISDESVYYNENKFLSEYSKESMFENNIIKFDVDNEYKEQKNKKNSTDEEVFEEVKLLSVKEEYQKDIVESAKQGHRYEKTRKRRMRDARKDAINATNLIKTHKNQMNAGNTKEGLIALEQLNQLHYDMDVNTAKSFARSDVEEKILIEKARAAFLIRQMHQCSKFIALEDISKKEQKKYANNMQNSMDEYIAIKLNAGEMKEEEASFLKSNPDLFLPYLEMKQRVMANPNECQAEYAEEISNMNLSREFGLPVKELVDKNATYKTLLILSTLSKFGYLDYSQYNEPDELKDLYHDAFSGLYKKSKLYKKKGMNMRSRRMRETDNNLSEIMKSYQSMSDTLTKSFLDNFISHIANYEKLLSDAHLNTKANKYFRRIANDCFTIKSSWERKQSIWNVTDELLAQLLNNLEAYQEEAAQNKSVDFNGAEMDCVKKMKASLSDMLAHSPAYLQKRISDLQLFEKSKTEIISLDREKDMKQLQTKVNTYEEITPLQRIMFNLSPEAATDEKQKEEELKNVNEANSFISTVVENIFSEELQNHYAHLDFIEKAKNISSHSFNDYETDIALLIAEIMKNPEQYGFVEDSKATEGDLKISSLNQLNEYIKGLWTINYVLKYKYFVASFLRDVKKDTAKAEQLDLQAAKYQDSITQMGVFLGQAFGSIVNHPKFKSCGNKKMAPNTAIKLKYSSDMFGLYATYQNQTKEKSKIESIVNPMIMKYKQEHKVPENGAEYYEDAFEQEDIVLILDQNRNKAISDDIITEIGNTVVSYPIPETEEESAYRKVLLKGLLMSAGFYCDMKSELDAIKSIIASDETKQIFANDPFAKDVMKDKLESFTQLTEKNKQTYQSDLENFALFGKKGFVND